MAKKEQRQVVYVMSGPAHLPYLVVSLQSLREHWQGKVTVYTWPESLGIVSRIAEDKRLKINVRKWDPEYRGKNDQFECKQIVMQQLRCEVGLYLDADTLIRGSIDPLFDPAYQYGFVATQFCNWTTKNGIVRSRIKRMYKFSKLRRALIDNVLNEQWPSVNGGVFACRPSSIVLPMWYKWTTIVRSIFISDETCLHALMTMYIPQKKATIAMGGAWNCSPKFQPKDLPNEDVVIWHFHGDSNTRLNKCRKGVDLWYTAYRRCIDENIGGVQTWRREIKNKYLDSLESKL